jgi:23S rRNA (adenine2503-C2)-methyltransferase
MPTPAHIFDLTRDELRELLGGHGLPSFRADQVLDWVYRKNVIDPAAMLNLSKADRELIGRTLRFSSGDIVRHQVATDGVQKLLVQWEEEEDAEQTAGVSGQRAATSGQNAIALPVVTAAANSEPGIPNPDLSILDSRRQTECVLIPVDDDEETGQRERRTACISSQIGCAVGCRFCASGLGGLDGDLSAGRIVEQVWRLGTLPGVGRVSNVVFMGMGEPLSNFTNVSRAIRTMNAPWGLGISARKITVSTVGLPAQIRRLAEMEIPVTLAISLHAPNDELRRQLIPWAQYVTIEQLLDAGDYYFEKTGREITLEYILLGGVNDQQEHARELASVARRLRANVNLIRYNEVKSLPYDRPHTNDVRQFQQVLREANVNTHIRASRGRDIAAACGQLRHETARA